jgi:hypothetical protein
MNAPIKWAAEVFHVREVSLLGTADLGFWRDRLLKEDLTPTEKEGRAQFLIISAEMKWAGIRFRELSFSVVVAPPANGVHRDAAFLVQAFNSRRLLAISERFFFSTPYDSGDVQLTSSVPCSIQLSSGASVVFKAAMQTDGLSTSRAPSHSGPDGWDGPIFIPRKRQREDGPHRVFFGKLSGHTLRYPFELRNDALTISGSPGCSGIFQDLQDSHFVAEEWLVRDDATHARSKTYKRSAVITGRPPVRSPQ